MRNVLFLILILLSQFSFAQKEYPFIQSLTTTDKIFHGEIGGTYSFTMYLKHFKYSNYHLSTYSVVGWYKYDNVGIKIPLTGFYDWSNGLTLYQFKNRHQDSLMLNFEEMKQNHWKEVAFYRELLGYVEKFEINKKDGRFMGLWKNGDQNLPVSLDSESIEIQQRLNFLHLDTNTVFDLKNVGVHGWKLKVVGATKDRTKVLIQYEYASNTNFMGQCGAASETEIAILKFDTRYAYQEIDRFVISSCYNHIDLEKTEILSPYLTRYTVIDMVNETTSVLLIDSKNATVEVVD